MKYTALILVLLFGAHPGAHAQERPEIYSVVGIAQRDTLSVRSRPSEKSPIVAKLPSGTTGIEVVGRVVMNGNDDWVPIRFSDGEGWVRPKFLSSRRQQMLSDASERERQSDYTDKPAESKTSRRNTFNDAIDRYNLMELEYNEELVRQKKVAAAAGDDEARQWLRENEWRVKLVRSMYDATHPKQ